MRWRLLVFQSLFTVTLFIRDQPSQFDFLRLMASSPCNQLDAQQWCASNAIREECTIGLETGPSDKSGSHVGIQSVQVIF